LSVYETEGSPFILQKEIGMPTTQEQLRELYYETLLNNGEQKCKDCRLIMKESGFSKTNLETFIALPNRISQKTIKHLFVAMEPSTKWFSPNKNDPAALPSQLILQGMYGFTYVDDLQGELEIGQSLTGPFLLQFAINNYLCNKKDNYLITDLSKCCIPLNQKKVLGNTRTRRFQKCIRNLKKEISIIGSPAIFTIGGTVSRILNQKRHNITNTPLYHYSGNGGAHAAVNNYYKKEKGSSNPISKETALYDIKKYAKNQGELIKKDSNISGQAEDCLLRTFNYFFTDFNDLTDSQLKWLFYYKTEFRKFK
jgi:hypothetical protein